jgi:hypothetical protein
MSRSLHAARPWRRGNSIGGGSGSDLGVRERRKTLKIGVVRPGCDSEDFVDYFFVL